MKRILFFVLLAVAGCKTSHVPPEKVAEKLGPNPYFEIDGQPVNQSELGKFNPTDIASLTTYYDKEAIERFGEKAKDGAVTIETKVFAINKYETFFKSYSKAYAEMIGTTNKDEIQYILNDRILTENFEGDLSLLNNKLLKELKIVDKNVLLDKYKVQGKKVGVVLKANKPKGLYRAKEKF